MSELISGVLSHLLDDTVWHISMIYRINHIRRYFFVLKDSGPAGSVFITVAVSRTLQTCCSYGNYSKRGNGQVLEQKHTTQPTCLTSYKHLPVVSPHDVVHLTQRNRSSTKLRNLCVCTCCVGVTWELPTLPWSDSLHVLWAPVSCFQQICSGFPSGFPHFQRHPSSVMGSWEGF